MVSIQDIYIFVENQWIGIISFIGMVFIAYIQIKRKSPCYDIKSTNLINDLDSKYEKLEMNYLFNDREVK